MIQNRDGVGIAELRRDRASGMPVAAQVPLRQIACSRLTKRAKEPWSLAPWRWRGAAL